MVMVEYFSKYAKIIAIQLQLVNFMVSKQYLNKFVKN